MSDSDNRTQPPTDEEAYEVPATDSFTKALTLLIRQFREQNPSIGGFGCTCHDGTKVKLTFGNKPPKLIHSQVTSRRGQALPERLPR